MAVLNVTKDNFEKDVLGADGLVLIDFWAAWCGPCKMMAPVLEQIAEENPDIKVGKLNIDEEPELAQKYRVMSIPTLILFENGEPKETSIGLVPKESVEKMFR
ncbi:thioredoxin [bacterium 210820-DFI.6.37]|nr:thioredoxin [bacterium 210820-DFI.6.37]